ncbi:sigma-70 family RNA polymerase sigma factor [Asaia sp. VD9]|uniref:RNA polymerase sigma factor n=1 Tax=Asaia sp. VD9 TaxID=3081235 RepID=UPI003017591A
MSNSLEGYDAASDEHLMERCSRLDHEAFNEIVRRYGKSGIRAAFRILGNAHLADDATQEALLRVWENAGKFDSEKSRFSAWFFTIVTNICLDYLKKKPMEPLPENFDVADERADTELKIQEAQSQGFLLRLCRALPKQERVAIALIYGEGYAVTEAAKIMGMHRKALGRLLIKCRIRLKREMTGAVSGEQDRLV